MGGATEGGCVSCSKPRAETETEAGGGGGGGGDVVVVEVVVVVVFISPPSDTPEVSVSSAGKDRARNK